MKNPGVIAIAAILTGIAMPGHAQKMSRSELQSKGATIVAKDELATLVKGATLRWTNTVDGSAIQIQLENDGSYAGHASAASGGSTGFPLSGTWQVTNDGKFCRAQVIRAKTDKICWTLHKLGDKYFFSVGSGSAVVLNISK